MDKKYDAEFHNWILDKENIDIYSLHLSRIIITDKISITMIINIIKWLEQSLNKKEIACILKNLSAHLNDSQKAVFYKEYTIGLDINTIIYYINYLLCCNDTSIYYIQKPINNEKKSGRPIPTSSVNICKNISYTNVEIFLTNFISGAMNLKEFKEKLNLN